MLVSQKTIDQSAQAHRYTPKYKYQFCMQHWKWMEKWFLAGTETNNNIIYNIRPMCTMYTNAPNYVVSNHSTVHSQRASRVSCWCSKWKFEWDALWKFNYTQRSMLSASKQINIFTYWKYTLWVVNMRWMNVADLCLMLLTLLLSLIMPTLNHLRRETNFPIPIHRARKYCLCYDISYEY